MIIILKYCNTHLCFILTVKKPDCTSIDKYKNLDNTPFLTLRTYTVRTWSDDFVAMKKKVMRLQKYDFLVIINI